MSALKISKNPFRLLSNNKHLFLKMSKNRENIKTLFKKRELSHSFQLKESKNSAQNLRDITKILQLSITPSTFCGYFPLTLNKTTGQFSFSWIKYPILIPILRILFSLTCVVYYFYNIELYGSVFGIRVSSTERLMEEYNTYFSFFVEGLLPLMIVLKRNHIQKFQEEFMDTIISLLSGNQQSVELRLAKVWYETRRVCLTIFAAFTCQCVKTFCIQYTNAVGHFKNGIPLWLYFNLLLMPFALSTIYLRLLTRIWLISLIKCFKVALVSVKEKIIKYLHTSLNGEKRNEIGVILKGYRKLERLVRTFNRNLGVYMVIGLLCLVVTLLMNIFAAVTYAKQGAFVLAMDYFLSGIFNMFTLYYMCRNAANMEEEVYEFFFNL